MKSFFLFCTSSRRFLLEILKTPLLYVNNVAPARGEREVTFDVYAIHITPETIHFAVLDVKVFINF